MRKLFSIVFSAVLLLIVSGQGHGPNRGQTARSPLGQLHTQTGRCYMTTLSTTGSTYALVRANST